MRIRIFTLKFDTVLERFDDSELQEFLVDKELLAAREHFFVKQETPYLVVFLTYIPGMRDVENAKKNKRERWRELLSDEQLPLFNTLREWRAERAKQDGVPPYVICTNLQFAHVVMNRPDSLSALGTIQGLGRAKVEKYGEEILALLNPVETEKPVRDQPELFDDKDEQEDADERTKA